MGTTLAVQVAASLDGQRDLWCPQAQRCSVKTVAGTVHLQRSDTVATLVFDNPSRRNAMSVSMWQQVSDHCRTISLDSTIRLVLLRGAGSQAFVAGADICEFTTHRTPERTESYDEMTAQAQSAIRMLPAPVVAVINGFCIGGGLALALAADVRFCDDKAVFGLPPARLGIGYSPAGVGALVDVIGPGPAAELLYSASWIDAEKARRWSLVNEVVAADELDDFVDTWITTATKQAPLSQQAAKRSIQAHLAIGPAKDSLAGKANELVKRCFGSRDYSEGVAAFTEKRSPVFEGR